TGSGLRDSWVRPRHMVRNAKLPGPPPDFRACHIRNRIIVIAVPVLVLGRLHSGPATVGFLWGAMGAAGLVSALIAGRFPSEGRERQMIAVAIVTGAVATAILPFANNLAVVAVAVTLLGLATGPFDIGLFTLRQRRTDPAWFGRAFAVSM